MNTIDYNIVEYNELLTRRKMLHLYFSETDQNKKDTIYKNINIGSKELIDIFQMAQTLVLSKDRHPLKNFKDINYLLDSVKLYGIF